MHGHIPTMYSTKKMNVVKLIVQKTGTYNDQFRRPFVTNMSNDTGNRILSAIENKQSVGAGMIANVAGTFLMPTATPEQQVGIPNGFNTPRLRFLLELMVMDNMGTSSSHYITGYTEYSDVSMNNLIDPKMSFFINNISETRNTSRITPIGTQSYQSVINSSHVLVNNQYQGIHDTNKTFSLRPENILTEVGVKDIRDAGLGNIFDARAAVISTPTLSNRRNNIAPAYVAGILDGYLQNSRSGEYDSHVKILENTAHSVEESDFLTNPFIKFISGRHSTKYLGAATANGFTLEDLFVLDPNTPNVMKVADFGAQNFHQTGATAGWGGSDGTTLFAATLSQSLPAYMTQFCFNVVHFTSTNHTINGEIVTTINAVKGFNNALDNSREIAAFVYRINSELLRGLSYNNQMPFQLQVNCDLIGETWIEISLNSEPMIAFVMPSFCDALTTPILTNDQNKLYGIANDFDKLMVSMVEQDSSTRGMSYGNDPFPQPTMQTPYSTPQTQFKI